MSILDPLILARIQFAFTISFHILFPAFTIGLASWLSVLEALWLKTGKNTYKEIYQYWVKIFAVSFGLGVVSGILMSYQFGTNWSVFSKHVGNIIGPLMGYEVLTAFFLEASFLGIMIFGWNRVSPRMHLASTIIVAIGTLISAFWILSANSWMHTPSGYRIDEHGVFFPTNWLDVIFNPSFPYRLAHMVTAAYLTTALVVAGVAGYYFIRKIHQSHARIMLGMAVLLISTLAPLQILLGDMHGLNTLKYQPAKISAMEGIWENEKGASFRIFGIPDSKEEVTKYSIDIPFASSIVLTHTLDGEVKGLKDWPKDKRPPVVIVFFAFRIMLAVGTIMLLTAIVGAVLYFRGKLFNTRWFHLWCMITSPVGFIGILAGWFVTEVGRQPYVVHNLLRTSDAASPVMAGSIAFSLTSIIAVYSLVFGVGCYFILRLMKRGPSIDIKEPPFGSHGLAKPVTIADIHLK
jgi:cytochrome d ubiquinol oxidase subunit I